MIGTILTHKIRKDLLRQNKKINHREYLRSLHPWPKFKYLAGYHKKKIVFFALVGLLSWHYDLHRSAYHYVLSIRSPQDFVSHLFFGTEKIQKTILQQQVIGWPFSDSSLQLLTKVYYQTDKNLIFGLGRNYLYHVYSSMGLLQKKEEEHQFWVNGGFYRKRNQLVSGVGYKQFLDLFAEAYKSLKKINSDLTEQQFLQQFMQIFIKKAPLIQKWQKQFNRQRHQEFLKSLLVDNDRKSDQICSLMRQDLEISQDQLESKLVELGMKGMGVRDKWLYWRNREILYSIRQSVVHRRLNSGAVEFNDRRDLQRRLASIQKQLSIIGKQKQKLKQKYRSLYAQEII